ncbi:hypothetical protein JQ597_22980 [Bradyrhizobium sp. AUGA SZCCT0177]|uniref:hypothetical protein n=1 Tax=unclassified Bradyrhizobium TaxID=2631580 RepID=UPI001BA758A4|nr:MULTISPECIES: hypothetical protein [unclassified Bradyrhizobium]MBR1230506.1 hypothetical protein [Bradyrhizobium sp. AUGA SZCCT0182]MBR1284917.1 hypothetical protein [Bradyrhizobium sp. AUGA SZCCT0177]
MLAPIRLGLALAIYLVGQTSSALACACCTNEGQRNVATVALDSSKQQEIESLRFGGRATLFTGEGDVEGIQGIASPAGTYTLSAQWREDRLVLSFRDAAGHTGTLALTRPPTISVFEVDPRDRPDRGRGPTLYKEWKLSAPASGSGVFQPGIATQQILTLILQGGGNSCTSSIDFTHWTLVMQGPKANYTLYGNLVR